MYVRKHKTLLHRLTLLFCSVAFVLVSISAAHVYALTPGISEIYVPTKGRPAELQELDKANVNANESGDTNVNTFVSNPCRYRSSGGATGASSTSLVGCNGVLESAISGIATVLVPTSVSTTDQNGQQVTYSSPGAVGTVVNLTAQLYNPPASSVEYVADVINTIKNPFGAQTAYAQGLGFSSLQPVLELWKLFRNVAYFFFVVIFVFVGFAIMLRSKIGGQAAVTIQQALPKLIVSLILVTFSYAIAGLMIDIMYLVIYFMIALFTSQGATQLSYERLTEIAFRENIFTNGAAMITGGVVGRLSGTLGNMAEQILVGFGVDKSISSILGDGGVNIVSFLVLAVALLVSLFRIFFGLLRAYAGIFISVVLSPIQLLLGALPGQNTFGAWIRGLAENLAVFPTLIFLIFMANYLSFRPGQELGQQTIGGFSPPQLGSNQGAGGTVAFALLQFGIISMMPSAMDLAKKIVSGKFDFDAAKAMGEFWKSGKPGIAAPFNIALGAGIGALGAREMFRNNPNKGAITAGGALLGGVFGGATGLPLKLGKQAVSGAAGYAGRALMATGTEKLTGGVERNKNKQVIEQRGKYFDGLGKAMSDKTKQNDEFS